MKDSINGNFVFFDVETGDTLFTKQVQLRVCHGEEPKVVSIEHDEFDGLYISFDFAELKELVNRKQYENT
jgi:hypothetical protein